MVLYSPWTISPLFENKQINCFLQMPKCNFNHLLLLFGKLVNDERSVRINKLVNEYLAIFQDKRAKNTIIGHSECLKISFAWFIVLEDRDQTGVDLCFWIWHS